MSSDQQSNNFIYRSDEEFQKLTEGKELRKLNTNFIVAEMRQRI